MAQSFVEESGQLLVIPGTYVNSQVQANQGGTAAAGVVTLIGEADEGPDFTKEADLNANSFGPDEIAAVIQKYGSGRLVDAFRAIVAAANDPAIVGAVSAVKIVKTNPSVAASATISRNGFGSYALLQARREGAPASQIKYRSEVSVAEVAPSTGAFAYTPHYSASAVSFALRNNGGTALSISIAQLLTGSAFCSLIEDVATGILASGGSQVSPLAGKSGVAISCAPVGLSTTDLTITLSSSFGVVPVVGDTLVIPANTQFGLTHDSAIIGATNDNRGAYIVTAVAPGVSSSTVTIKRINAPSGIGAVQSASGVVNAAEDDILIFKNVTVRNITGQDRQATAGITSGNFTSVVSGSDIVITSPANWSSKPVVGDYMRFTSTYAGVLSGMYQVTAVTDNTVSASRLSNGSAGANGSSAAPATFTVEKPVIDGLGKSLEVNGTVTTVMRNPLTTAGVNFSNSLLVSASEYKNALTVSRGTTSDTYLSGGDLLLSIGCSQASATVVVGSSQIDFKVGLSTIFSAPYAQYKTLADLITLINSQSTFRASLVAAKFSSVKPSDLDRGTFGISASLASANPGRLKKDAIAWSSAVNASGLVSAALSGQAGLPEAVTPDQLLTGGSKAGSTGAHFVNAIDACESVDTNFLVPLVAKDASDDIAAAETESSSSYTVDAVNAYLKSHVIKMSALKARKNRMALCAKSGAYSAQKEAASQLASFRAGLAFQDVKLVSGDGTIKQYQPWMSAVIAAGMQSAAGFKGIVKKFANITGLVKPEGDFNSSKPSDLEDALQAGLLILERVPTGGFRWVSDQLTYSTDNNFVYNSLQAVYIADLMALTLIQNFDRAIVGKSVAEISAAGALSFLDSEMFNFKRLRWIAASDDAPKGYKNASVKITGGVMQVAVEVKLAGLIYFVPISFTISQVTQEASQ